MGSRGGSGLLLTDELVRAVRCESSAAIVYWFGASQAAVVRWRKAFGVGRVDNPGTNRLVRASAGQGGDASRRRGVTAEERQRRREQATAQNLVRFPRSKPARLPWAEEELQLLGKVPDAELAAHLGRSATAVRVMRTRRGVPSADDKRRRSAGLDRSGAVPDNPPG